MKHWEVKVKLNWDMQRIVTITVKANTERKAKIFAKEKVLKTGNYFAADVISIKEMEK